MQKKYYDFAIIGAGAAGLQLALRLAGEAQMRNKRILIIDKDEKRANDRTWCFWEKGEGIWDEIVSHQWTKARFQSRFLDRTFDLSPYRYKMIRGADFYRYAKDKLGTAENLTWVLDEVTGIVEGNLVAITCGKNEYLAKHVFDSRVGEAFYKADDNYNRIWQHFKGWVVRTDAAAFEPDQFTMMDFRLKWQSSTSFTYILPFSPREALVEFTLFTPDLIEDNEYEQMLSDYLDTFLPEIQYSVTEREKGVIPMTDFPFHHFHTSSVTKIGTAGGWVKPSSGYSFKNCEKYTGLLVEALKSGGDLSGHPVPSRFQFYDRIFIDVLTRRNDLGERIFSDMYEKNPIQRIFRFLDNETNLLEELQVIRSFDPVPFIRSLYYQFTR